MTLFPNDPALDLLTLDYWLAKKTGSADWRASIGSKIRRRRSVSEHDADFFFNPRQHNELRDGFRHDQTAVSKFGDPTLDPLLDDPDFAEFGKSKVLIDLKKWVESQKK